MYTDFDRMKNALQRFLQLFGLEYNIYIQIPSSFTRNCGWLLADIIQHLTKKKIPGLPLTRPETLSSQQQEEMLACILNFLRKNTAMITCVNVKDLLNSTNKERHLRAWVCVLAQVRKRSAQFLLDHYVVLELH